MPTTLHDQPRIQELHAAQSFTLVSKEVNLPEILRLAEIHAGEGLERAMDIESFASSPDAIPDRLVNADSTPPRGLVAGFHVPPAPIVAIRAERTGRLSGQRVAVLPEPF